MANHNSAEKKEEIRDLPKIENEGGTDVDIENTVISADEKVVGPDNKVNETENAKKPDDKKETLHYFLKISVPLLLICALIALMMALVNGFTKDRIKSNNLKATQEAISRIYPKFDSSDEIDIDVELPIKAVYRLNEGDVLLGYCVSVQPSGFNGAIEMMVGVNPEGNITGVEIISHTETPGIGAAADDPEYLKNYIGLYGNISFGEGIDALTGATISSKAILSGVNAAVEAINNINGQTVEGGAQ